MAERSYNGRIINTNPTMTGVGSTTTVNSWIGDSSQGWGVVNTTSGTISACEYTTYLNEDCIRLSVVGMTRSGGITGQMCIANISSYPGPTLSPAVLSGIAENVSEGKQYKTTMRYFISALAADTGSMRFAISRTWYNSNGTRLVSTDSTLDTTVSTTWETYEETVTAPARAAYLIIRATFLPNVDPTTNGSGTVYVSDFRVTEVLPARTTALSRTPATNRVAVRDMGTALSFDGVDDYVEIPDADIPASTFQNGFTLSAWINTRNLGESNNGRIFDKSTDVDGQNGFRMRMGNINPTAINFAINAGTQRQSAAVIAFPKSNRWIHTTVVVSDAGFVTHYLDGQQSGTPGLTSAPSNITTTNALRIGNRSAATDRTFDGIIDEPRIWNRALTADEIKNLYLYGIVPQDGLVAEYLFDEASGTTALDTSGNGNDGTISGCTYTFDTPLNNRTDI